MAASPTAALLAGSVALLGFGVDGLSSAPSGLALVWNLGDER